MPWGQNQSRTSGLSALSSSKYSVLGCSVGAQTGRVHRMYTREARRQQMKPAVAALLSTVFQKNVEIICRTQMKQNQGSTKLVSVVHDNNQNLLYRLDSDSQPKKIFDMALGKKHKLTSKLIFFKTNFAVIHFCKEKMKNNAVLTLQKGAIVCVVHPIKSSAKLKIRSFKVVHYNFEASGKTGCRKNVYGNGSTKLALQSYSLMSFIPKSHV